MFLKRKRIIVHNHLSLLGFAKSMPRNKDFIMQSLGVLTQNTKLGLRGHFICIAGFGSSCSHAAALLLKLEAAVHFNPSQPTACNNQLCKWEATKKSVKAITIMSIDFSRARNHILPKAGDRSAICDALCL